MSTSPTGPGAGGASRPTGSASAGTGGCCWPASWPWPASRRSPTPCWRDIFGCCSAGISSADGLPRLETRLIGMVLAAGAGRRLRPDTDALPKALLPVDGQVTILDIALRNLAAVGLRDIVIVVGYAADAIRDRVADLERDHGVRLTLVDNDRAEEWNNAYSLWLAREHFAAGALLVNGGTVHPVSIEKTLLTAAQAQGDAQLGLILAVDDVKRLAEGEM